MKALILKEYNRFAYEEVPTPDLGPQDVLVQVKACGICGSDVHGMDGSTGRRVPPLIMGHEASGVIAKVGDEVVDWAEGERVTFDSTVYSVDDWYARQGLYNLSDNRQVVGVSCVEYRRHGAFAEYVSVPQHILYRLPGSVSFNQAALVEPLSVDLEDHKLELAQRMGATAILNPRRDDISAMVRSLTEGRGADIAFEAVGITATVK